jgi:hypothetical protein
MSTDRTCSVDGCERHVRARGWCARHYDRWRVNGDPVVPRPENLELWVSRQPKGQRPEDLAEWVVEHYPDLVAEALARRC